MLVISVLVETSRVDVAAGVCAQPDAEQQSMVTAIKRRILTLRQKSKFQ
jgi:hypothetical protein